MAKFDLISVTEHLYYIIKNITSLLLFFLLSVIAIKSFDSVIKIVLKDIIKLINFE